MILAPACQALYDIIFVVAKERCWSGLSGAPGERVSPLATVGSNPTLSAKVELEEK